MKKIFNKIWSIKFLLVLGVVILFPHFANAQLASGIFDFFSTNAINSLFANLSYIALSLTSYLVAIAGTFLSVSINLTIGIGDLYNSLPALKGIWLMIRNFASILVIFVLLYTSIRTILGDGTGAVKKLVGGVIVAGLLINFSLFFTKVLIDASNLVSLQFYKAMAPEAAKNIGSQEVFTLNSAGLADTFLSVLQVQKVYGQNKVIQGENVKFNVIIATSMGVLIMITAAFSLFAAAITFVARTGILLFMMAVSPLFVIAIAFPSFGKKGKQYMELFKSQLIFMPVYLFLMYVALSFIASDEFAEIFKRGIPGNDSVSSQLSDKGVPGMIGIVVQYVIALILINIPLVAAISLGGKGAGWVPTGKDVNKKLLEWGKGTADWTRRNTYSVAAAKIADSGAMKNLAAKSAMAGGALRGLRGAAKSYNEHTEKKTEEKTKFGESLGYNKERVAEIEYSIKTMKQGMVEEDVTIARLQTDPNSDPKDIKAAKDQKKKYQEAIKDAEARISKEKRDRQIIYAKRLDPRDIDEQTGNLKSMTLLQRAKKRGWVGSDEEAARAKIEAKNIESDIEKLKDKQKDNKEKQKTIEGDIKRLEQRAKTEHGLSDKEKPELAKLKNDLYEHIRDNIAPIQKDIEEKEIQVKRFKDLS